MNKYLKLYESHSQYVEPEIRPNVSYCKQENEVHYNPVLHDYSQDYLTFVAISDCTFSFNKNVNYSVDNGNTWTELASGISTETISPGRKIMWKGELTHSMNFGIGTFSSTGYFNVEGCPISLKYGDNFRENLSFDCFTYLFSSNTGLVSAENLILPATELTIAHAYAHMFRDCTSLTTAPKLPATTLSVNCYLSMFLGCTSLTVAPELPATTLQSNSYQHMFNGCSSLQYVKAMFLTIPDDITLYRWLYKVSPTGTFVKNANASWNVTGDSGIPTGWTIQTATE